MMVSLPRKVLGTYLRFRRRSMLSGGGYNLMKGIDGIPVINLTDHHVWSVEERGLNVRSLRYLPCNQYYHT